MSLLGAAILVAGGAFLGGWLSRAMGRTSALPPSPSDDDPPDSDGAEDLARSGGERAAHRVGPRGRAKDPFAAFPCRLGDVVLASDGEEAWLESALVFYEETPVLVVFMAPNAGADRAILARPKPREDVLWLTSAPELGERANWGPGEEPPSSLLHRGERYERMRRLPLSADRHGPSAPEVADVVLLAEYKSITDRRLLAVFGGPSILVWEGRVLGPGTYEVLPGGR